jgi:hypothetical protein
LVQVIVWLSSATSLFGSTSLGVMMICSPASKAGLMGRTPPSVGTVTSAPARPPGVTGASRVVGTGPSEPFDELLQPVITPAQATPANPVMSAFRSRLGLLIERAAVFIGSEETA